LGNGKIIDSYTKKKVPEEDDEDEEHDHDYYIEGDMAVCKVCEDSIPLKDYTGFIKTKEEKIMYLVGGESYIGDNGLLVLGKDKYFFDVDTGYVFTGKTKIWGLEEELDENGKLISGVTGFEKDKKGTKHYIELEVTKGWKTIDGDEYYFSNVTEYMRKGITNIHGDAYIFTEDGKLIKGKLDHGVQDISKYLDKETPHIVYVNAKERIGFTSGWQEVEGDKYYFSMSNQKNARTGVATVGGKEYEFDKDGKLINEFKSEFVNTGKGTFYVNENGEKVHGWQEIDGRIYYFSSSNTGY